MHVFIQATTFFGCATFGKLFNLCVPWFICKLGKISTYFRDTVLLELHGIINEKHRSPRGHLAIFEGVFDGHNCKELWKCSLISGRELSPNALSLKLE